MIKNLPPPTEAEEYRNTAEILRDLAAQMRFGITRNELNSLAANLDRLAAHAETNGHIIEVFCPFRISVGRQMTPRDGRRSSHRSRSRSVLAAAQ